MDHSHHHHMTTPPSGGHDHGGDMNTGGHEGHSMGMVRVCPSPAALSTGSVLLKALLVA